MQPKTDRIIISAILTLGALELYAMHLGFDGFAFHLSVAGICGLGGFHLAELWRRR